jgi:hypothetical protein
LQHCIVLRRCARRLISLSYQIGQPQLHTQFLLIIDSDVCPPTATHQHPSTFHSGDSHLHHAYSALIFRLISSSHTSDVSASHLLLIRPFRTLRAILQFTQQHRFTTTHLLSIIICIIIIISACYVLYQRVFYWHRQFFPAAQPYFFSTNFNVTRS